MEFGNVGLSNCVYFRFKARKGGFEPLLVYSPDDLEHLLALVRQAMELKDSVEEEGVLRIGAMPPKPATLRLALVRASSQPPRLLIRLLHLRQKVDLMMEPEEFHSLLEVGRAAGAPPLEGPLSSLGGSRWQLAEAELETDEFTVGTGRHRQYCRLEEVPAGQPVRAWTDGKGRVVCFETRTEESSSESELAAGRHADELLLQGRNHEACREYYALARDLMKTKSVTSRWAAKVVLGVLLAEIADGNDQMAQQVWLGQSPEPVLQMGIEAIESGKVGQTDHLSYRQISAYFHSLNPDPHQAQLGVNSVMESVCREMESVPTELRRMALSNWYLFLYEIFEGEPPADVLRSWKEESEGLQPPVRPEAISFPRPESWCEPTLPVEEQPAPAAVEKPKPAALFGKVSLIAVAVCLVMVVFIGLAGRSRARVGPAPPSALRVSMEGVKFGESLESLRNEPGWEFSEPAKTSPTLADIPYWKGVKVLKKPTITIQFDAEDKMMRMSGGQVEYDGEVLFPKGMSREQIIQDWGKPAGKTPAKIYLYYVFEDGGDRFVLEIGRDGYCSIERTHGRWSDAAPVSLKRRWWNFGS